MRDLPITVPDQTDFVLMLALWKSGSPTQRDVALQMADDNRKRCAPTNPGRKARVGERR